MGDVPELLADARSCSHGRLVRTRRRLPEGQPSLPEQAFFKTRPFQLEDAVHPVAAIDTSPTQRSPVHVSKGPRPHGRGYEGMIP